MTRVTVILLACALGACSSAPRTCFSTPDFDPPDPAALGPVVERYQRHWAKRADETELRAAIAALYEATELDPGNSKLHTRLAEGLYLLGDGYLRAKDTPAAYEEMGQKFREATQAGEDAVAVANPAFKRALCRRESPEAIAAHLTAEDAPAVYMWLASLGRLGLSENVVTILQYDKLLEAIGERLIALAPGLYFGAGKRFLGAYFSRAPFPEGRMDKARALLEEAIAENPAFFGNRTLIAELIFARLGDRKAFDEQIEFVLSQPADAIPEFVPEQLGERMRAQWLKDKAEWLFPPAGAPSEERAADTWFSRPAGNPGASGPLEGHSLELLRNGMAVTDARFAIVDSAKRSLYVSAFSWHNDNVGIALIERVCRKIKKSGGKLEVKILLENFASKELLTGQARLPSLSDLTGRPPLPKGAQLLKKCGAKVLFYRPRRRGLEHVLQVRHEKLFIADGEQLLTGGSNVGDYYHTSSPWSAIWYDLDIVIKGPVACWYHNQFQDSWEIGVGEEQGLEMQDQARAREISDGERRRLRKMYGLDRMKRCDILTAKRFGEARAYGVYGRPASTTDRPLMESYLQAIDGAMHSIQLYAPYFVPGDEFAAALVRAARRGVKITVLTNSVESNDESTAIFSAMLLSVIAPLGARPHCIARAGRSMAARRPSWPTWAPIISTCAARN